MSEVTKIVVGCQGWNYDDWVTPAGARRVFYPRGTRSEAMLATYARAFLSVEVDSTFYAVPAASTVEGWRARTPDGFTFSLKLPQEITHREALRGQHAARVLESFCERARLLGPKLASVLVQMPPAFEAAPENVRALREFLPLLPEDVRFAFEFRDYGWFDLATAELLARHGASVALVEGPWVSRARVWQLAEETTEAGACAPFVYARWMGERDLVRFDEVQRPRAENLRDWAGLLKRIAARGRDVYAYFSNFYEGHAPASANELKRLLGQTAVAPEELESQPSLF